ncbi:24049_t:CDS:1, partial [Gigaspora margarita]
AYYKLEALLAEKGWNNASRKKFNTYFLPEKRKAIWKILKRVHQLFVAREEGYLYIVEHINITILEKMYNEDFLDILLVKAHAQRQGELYHSL